MAQIKFKNISHSYDLNRGEEGNSETSWALEDINLVWKDGTANALLGPSGCGKTTMLNIISGLLRPTKGQILIDGIDATDLSPQERHIAQVFQFPVVYDSMNVYNNLAFPLNNRGVDKKVIKKKVNEVAEILDLTDYLYSSTSNLNSAEKQKISLGRGIIRDDTVAILLDEPLTVIDPKKKGELRRKLKQIQEELKITMIYVTHDQHEALTLADYVAIIEKGELVQNDTPEVLYSDPVEPFVGYFIGSPGMNFIDCKVDNETLDCEEFKIEVSDKFKRLIRNEKSNLKFGIRPESIVLNSDSKQGIPFEVLVTENLGNNQIVTLQKGKVIIKCRADISLELQARDNVNVVFPENNIKLYKNNKAII